MLVKNRDVRTRPVADALQRNLEDTLHIPARIAALEHTLSLPSFLSRMYRLHEGHMVGRRFIFLATIDNSATPSDIAKHVALVRSAVDAIVVFVAPWLSAHNRARLIGKWIPFVVPGNQLYIPDLAIDLRERFRTPKPRCVVGLSPAPSSTVPSRPEARRGRDDPFPHSCTVALLGDVDRPRV